MAPTPQKLIGLLATVMLLMACTTGRRPALPAPVFRLSAVAISVQELTPAIDWYRSSLGLTLERQMDFPELGLRLAWLVSHDFQVELVEQRGSRSRQSLVPEATNPAIIQGFGKIGFLVEDVDAWASRLRAKGVTFQVDLRDDQPTQTRTFIVVDNSGNWLQFSRPLSGPG